MQNINVGVIGFGTVGVGVVKILLKDGEELCRRTNCPITLKKIADLDVSSDRGIPEAAALLTDNADEILNDPEINVVVEVIGGESPAKKFIERALLSGKHVVTSNKEVIAKHGLYFTEIAQKNNCTILYEAAVGGGIPVLHAIRNSLSANRIEKIFGVVNGTTNYILSSMTESGADFNAVLREAQKLGYAEADPKNDVEGFDAAYKLSILASLAFRCPVDYSQIYREGITGITAKDVAAAAVFGYAIKMLAIGINREDSLELRVHPVMIEQSHPLASVNDVFNAIYIQGNNLGSAMLYGRGAGRMPTASAVVGDIMNLAFAEKSEFSRDTFYAINKRTVMRQEDCVTGFFLRCTVADESGVLASLASVFAKHSISIRTIQQADGKNGVAEITIITHPVKEVFMQCALSEMKLISCVEKIESVIRVGLGI